jgi:ketosteroid isomerase-like protein
MRFCVAALLAAVAAGGFGPTRKTDDTLEKLRSDFVLAFNAKDAAKVASFYADDAIAMPPNDQIVNGRSGIEATFKKAFDNNVGSISLQTIESVTGGDWGFQAGTWKLTTGAAGSIAGAVVVAESPRVMVGKNMVIYKRVGNGWKLAYDIWNDDAVPPGR